MALANAGAKDAAAEAPAYLRADIVGAELPEHGLDATSFLTMMGSRMGPLGDARKLLEAFESFDERDEGVVDVAAMREILAGDDEAVRGALMQLERMLVPPFLDRSKKQFAYRKCRCAH